MRRTDGTLAAPIAPELDVLPDDVLRDTGPGEPSRPRPNYGGDLETMLGPTPCFGTSLRGYDRVEVDNYVAWAEIQLLAAQRENQDLVAHNAAYVADLETCRKMLAHSPASRELGRVSRRVEEILQLAADEAADLVAAGAAEAERLSAQARAQASQTRAEATGVLDHARAKSERILRTAAEDRDRLDQQAAAARAAAMAEAADRLRRQEQRARQQQESAAAAAAGRLAAVQKDIDELSSQREKSRTFLRRMTEQISKALEALPEDTSKDVLREEPRPSP